MSDKIIEEQIRQTAEALNHLTADAVKRGFRILVERDTAGRAIYVHAEKEDDDGRVQEIVE